MACRLESVTTVYRFLGTLNFRIYEFDNDTALNTGEVVVVGMVVGMFITTRTVIATGFPGKARIRQ
jgi:hypothetical protein